LATAKGIIRDVILLIDLDNTIYPASSGVLRAIDRRMSAYMIEKLGFTTESADETRMRYWITHGTTMKGLKANYGIDEDDFLRYVHDLPVGDMLLPDVALRDALANTPYPKFVFTNADGDHAMHVIKSLGVAELFDAVFDVISLNFVGKPYPESYIEVERRVRALLDGKCGEIDKREIVFFDDYPAYLKGAHEHGWTTVHIDEKCDSELASEGGAVRVGGIEPWIDYTIKTIHSFPDVVKIIESSGATGLGGGAKRDSL
jgi:putative hydrolase of the HAD superfamily